MAAFTGSERSSGARDRGRARGLLVVAMLLLAAGAYRARHRVEAAFAHLSLRLHSGHSGRPSRPTSPAAKNPPGWTFEIAEGGELHVRYDHAEVASFHYNFFGEAWKWVGFSRERVSPPPGALAAFRVGVPDLDVGLDLVIRSTAPNELVYEYTLTAKRPLRKIGGGGLEFDLAADSPALPRRQIAELLPSNRGFSWRPVDDAKLSVTFDVPLAADYFEPSSDEKTIRCFLLGVEHGGDVEPGTRTYSMTVRLPAGISRRPSETERYGGDAGASWRPGTVAWDSWPVDVSFLSDGERPAGKHGRVLARGDELVFEDGTPARFWGTNVQAYTVFVGKREAVANQAKRLAALGYNLVRLCHLDSAWASPNVFAPGDTTRKLDDAALASLDWWVKCLRDQGIYVWLDLKMERTFRSGDGIEGFDELTRSEPWGRGFYFVDPRLEALGEEFARQFLGRVNRFTGLSYVNDPAIVGVVVTNEDDLTAHFANLMLPNHHNPVHTEMLRKRIEEVAPALGISTGEALRTWEPGPSKVVMADLEARLFQRATTNLRKLGFRGLVAGGNYWGDQDFLMLPSLTVGDVVDAHAYGVADSLGTNPHLEPNFVTYLAATSVGKPVSITEWNVEYPIRDRFVAPLYVAAIGSLQGWDAPMQYGYWQQAVEPPWQVDKWSSAYDPALIALMPAAAVMFRRQHVRPALKTYRLELDKDEVYSQAIGPRSSAAVRTLVEQSKVVIGLPDLPELPWDGPATVEKGTARVPSPETKPPIVIRDPQQDFLSADRTDVVSDTGEITRDWARELQTIDTPKSQAATGFIGGAPLKLRDVTFRIRTPAAAAVVTSLDGAAIADSRRLLVTVVGQAASSPNEKLPMLAQPVEGSITIRTKQRLRVVALSPDALPRGGDSAKPIASTRRDGTLTFEIPAHLATHWFLIEP